MKSLSKLDQGIALIRQAFAEHETDLKADLIARITGNAKSAFEQPVISDSSKHGKRVRAPKGAAKAFVDKVLGAHPNSRFDDIVGRRSTTAEKAISPATIRKELLKGRDKGDYRSDKGAYSLAK